MRDRTSRWAASRPAAPDTRCTTLCTAETSRARHRRATLPRAGWVGPSTSAPTISATDHG